jgi:hypothetical protein
MGFVLPLQAAQAKAYWRPLVLSIVASESYVSRKDFNRDSA